jgi:O-antigen ligase
MSLKSFAADPYLMLFVFFAGVRNSGEAVWVMKGMLAILTVVSLLALADAFGVVDVPTLEPLSDDRFSGPLGGANSYGGLMGMYIPPAFAFASVSRGPTRALWLLSAGTCLLLLLFTGSRGALVGLVGGAFLGTIPLRDHVSARYLLRIWVVSAALMLAALALLVLQHGDMLYDRFVRQSGGDAFTQTSGRSMIWGEALSQMADAPWSLLVGFGWKTFDLTHDLASHNQYLDYFFNLGIIGLSLILIIYGLVFSYLVKGVRSASGDSKAILTGFLVGYLSFLLAGLFSNRSSLWPFFWASTGVALRLAADSVAVARSRISGEHPGARRTRALPHWDAAT